MSALSVILPRTWARTVFLPPADLHFIDSLFEDKLSAIRLGKRYLAETPEESSLTVLRNLVFPKCPDGKSPYFGPNYDGSFFSNRFHSDFRAGQVANIDGWILSRTELRLCAIAALWDQ